MKYTFIGDSVEIVAKHDRGYDIAVNGRVMPIGHETFWVMFKEEKEVKPQADVVVNEIMESFDITPIKITKSKKKVSK